MADKSISDLLGFDVEYEDGQKIVMLVNKYDLRDNDFVAWIIARERQEKGSLAPGKIVSIRRR
jgi:hypothetical protein